MNNNQTNIAEIKDTVTLDDIEQAAQRYANARQMLSDVVTILTDRIDRVKNRFLPNIRLLVASAAAHETELKTLITESNGLFTRPKTQIFHGIKVGYAKGKGGIEFEDPEQVVQLIMRHYAKDEAMLLQLLNTKITPSKDGLEQLPVSELKKLACTVRDTSDHVVCKPIDDEVDKAVTALLKAAVADAQAEIETAQAA